MVAAPLSFDSQTGNGLRPVNLSHDVAQVVGLLNLAFRSALQAEGRRLGNAQLAAYPGWTVRWRQFRQGLVPGFVWEVDGRIVGNVSILPTRIMGRFAVANVAVHPDFRRRGIARSLMEAALDMVENHSGQVVILQVRHDNDGAIRLYRSLGFHTVGRVTSWEASYSQVRHLPVPVDRRRPDQVGPYFVRPLRANEWRAAWELDRQSVEPDLHWPEPLEPDAYRHGVWQRLEQLFSGRRREYWLALTGQDQFAGVATILSEWGRAHHLALRAHPAWRGEVERPLLAKVLRRLEYLPRRHIRLDHPAGDVVTTDLLSDANFGVRRTLTVMRYDCR
ncbi:MAG: N-acetyltransferase [Anaerolineae bacterium]|nr:N-acetyltransferase [Anaerolineae bacterium]